jgi:hypothetical protein
VSSPIHFDAGPLKELEDRPDTLGNVWWSPNGWVFKDGTVRVPIQHAEEPGAASDAVLLIDDDGTTEVRP